MGTFRVEVQGTGNHGCQRDVKNEDVVEPHCGSPACVDCITREYVTKLLALGTTFAPSENPDINGYAKLTHWPGQKGTVVDDLLSRKRTGSF